MCIEITCFAGMFISHLNILNFKNISELQLDFTKKIIALTGKNACGKTTILDVIYYLAMTKSYFSASDIQNIKHQQEFFVLFGKFKNNDEQFDVSCSVKKNEGKYVAINQKNYNRIAEHIGKIPVVIMAPQDLNLITEYSDTRRKFLDALISKFDKEYLNALIQYQKLLQNRNALLKQSDNNLSQKDLIDVYSEQMVPFGELILKKRKKFFEDIKPLVKTTYQQLQDNNETLELKYISTIQNDFAKELENSFSRDLKMGYTTVGIHRDDFDILLNDYPAKNYASQGQLKTVTFALKWIELIYLYQQTNIHPILLIDDMYDRMDDERIEKLKSLILNGIAEQIFITDTNYSRIKNLFKENENDVQILQIN